MNDPDCYNCIFRNDLPGNAHSSCSNHYAKVTGNEHGKRNGWFFWPYNFDPVWLESCTGFEIIVRIEVDARALKKSVD